MVSKWTHLIRFRNNGAIHFGDAIFPAGSSVQDIFSIAKDGNLRAKVVSGDPLAQDATLTDQELPVDTLLSPLTQTQVPIIRCVGLNHMKHIQEGGRTPPPHPWLFIKPSACLAGFDNDILIPKIAQQTLDYEGELVRLAHSLSVEMLATCLKTKLLDYVAGFVCSNDISCRIWQRDPSYAGSVPQWCFSKGFDHFAPIGPMIVSPQVLGAADQQGLKTIVNGEVRQDSNTNDLLFGVKQIVAFASQGTTLPAGSLIMTGTPAGVAMGMKEPQDLKNQMVFQ